MYTLSHYNTQQLVVHSEYGQNGDYRTLVYRRSRGSHYGTATIQHTSMSSAQQMKRVLRQHPSGLPQVESYEGRNVRHLHAAAYKIYRVLNDGGIATLAPLWPLSLQRACS